MDGAGRDQPRGARPAGRQRDRRGSPGGGAARRRRAAVRRVDRARSDRPRWSTCRSTSGTCRPIPRPATRLLDAAALGQLDAVTFTCSYAVHNAFELAGEHRSPCRALDRDVLAVAVGPVTAEALQRHGVRASCSRSGPASVDGARARRPCSMRGASDAVPRRRRGALAGPSLIDDAGAETELTRGEARLLATLVDCAPHGRAEVGADRRRPDDHAAEAAVARLRGKLGPLGRRVAHGAPARLRQRARRQLTPAPTTGGRARASSSSRLRLVPCSAHEVSRSPRTAPGALPRR